MPPQSLHWVIIPGYNSLYSNDYYDIYSTYSGTIYARGNWWGSYPAYPSVTANVDYSNALSSDPNTWAGQIVESSTGKEVRGLLTKISGSAADDPGMKEVDQAYKLFLNENYEGALSLFQAIVLKYPDSFAGSRALVFADRILEKLGRDSKTNLNSVITQRQNSKVASVANSLLMSRHVKEGNYNVALTSALALAGNTDKLIVKDALYNAGNILWYRLDNTTRGAEYFRKLIAEYPGDPLSISAQSTLGEWSGKASQPIAQTSLSQTAGLSLQNYPNPFNPTTVIHFTLPQSGVVSLKVFDMLGREVATLLNEYRNAGSYQVSFNGSSVTSGVYFYKLEANGRSLIQKMMLVK
ncbi:MAG: T9SS type A sorting domain-containing protein [Ignavibacteriales bacterium]|nr:T9SS type A sorting domain-containing protein [Ignavibacteriales bacterium]